MGQIPLTTSEISDRLDQVPVNDADIDAVDAKQIVKETRTQADADIDAINDGQLFFVRADETVGGQPTILPKVSGAFQTPVILRSNLSYIDARDYGLLGQGEDAGEGFETMVNAAIAANKAIKFPQGQTRLTQSDRFTLPANHHLSFFSDGGAELYIDQNNYSSVQVDGTINITLTNGLAVDAPRFARTIEVTDATGIEIGDILNIRTSTVVETGWNYKKNCIRRVAEVDGNTVWLDKALSFFFTAAEVDEIWVMKPALFTSDKIDYFFNADSGAGSGFALRRGMSARFTNGKAESPEPGWGVSFSDGIRFRQCFDIKFENFNFIKLRYCPGFNQSRGLVVRNFRAESVRHLDCADWSEDIYFEDGIGVDTDGIIQSHPCININFKNVSDSTTSTMQNLAGFDIRALGSRVENCQVTSQILEFGQNTGAIRRDEVFWPPYQEMADSYHQVIDGFRSTHAVIPLPAEGSLTVKNSYVPYINDTEGNSNPNITVTVDPGTIAFAPFDRSVATAFDSIEMQGFVQVSPIDAYVTDRISAKITGVTNANPGVVTAVNHGLIDGQTVTIDGVSGMDQNSGVNYSSRPATVIDADSFSYNRNTTNSGTYESGGRAWQDVPETLIAGVTQGNPCVVSSTGHGLSDGDIVYIDGAEGMTDINSTFYQVAGATTDTFQINTVSGAPVDSTSFTAYTSGGAVTKQALVSCVDAAVKPNIGTKNGLKIKSRVFSQDSNTETSVEKLVALRLHATGQMKNTTRLTSVKISAISDSGFAKCTHSFSYQPNDLGNVQNFNTEIDNANSGEMSVSVSGLKFHQFSDVAREAGGGLSSSDTLGSERNERYYLQFLIDVQTPNNEVIKAIDLELEETVIS